jgi:putative nucleotidyltransferase with HDIG domain
MRPASHELRETPPAVQGLLATLRRRDAATGAHTKDVAQMAEWVAEAMRLTPREREELRHVALLHDLGKVAIPDAILLKDGPLTDGEWEIVRRHPAIGARMVATTGELGHLSAGIRSHHERWDGTGYPDGLRGRQIPVASRIVAVCDAFHAMTSDRPYRAALTIEQALDELEASSGTQLDPEIVGIVLHRYARTRRRSGFRAA